jgi:diguanylate cyclase
VTPPVRPPARRRRRPAAVLAGVLVLCGVLVVSSPWTSPRLVSDLANLTELLLAALAASTALWRARRCRGRRRRAWTAVSAGCAGWAAGQAVWCWYEVLQRQAAPFPSVADAGFLLFPLAMCTGLWLYLPPDGWRQRRRLLDAFMVTAALGLVSWSTVLSAVVEAGAEGRLGFAVSIAYPALDLVLVVLVVLSLAATRTDQLALGLLGAGLLAFTLADSGFAYQQAVGGSFTSGTLVDLGWIVGFALLAMAPLTATGDDAREQDTGSGLQPVRLVPTSLLPYVAVLAGAALVAFRELNREQLASAERLLLACTVLLVLARQFTTLRENGSLLADLAHREAQLRHQAFHDGLTGLANRALFNDRLSHALELHRGQLRPLAVLLCDLDDFKLVNDTFGHAAGDDLLVRVAERLRGAIRSTDTLARLGGDEFAVLVEGGDSAEQAATRLVDALSVPFTVCDTDVVVRTSVGVGLVPAAAGTPTRSALLRQADTAMYAAKRAGKGAVRLYEPGMSLLEAEERRMADALREALRAGTLELVYQPVVTVATGAVAGVESLLRWTWDGRVVPPAQFVPVAERTGLVAELTDHVLERACAQLAAWSRQLGVPELCVGVNVAPQDLVGGTLAGRVADVLHRHGIGADRLVLEITETGLLTDLDAAREATGALRRLGVRLALDDFGVGYSSLAHLNLIPLQILKIDRQFTAGLGRDPGQARFVRALLALARDLGLDVVAEGVEQPEQLASLRAMGCEMAQGFLLAGPGTPAEVEQVLVQGVPDVRGRPVVLSPAAGLPVQPA